MWFRVCSTGEVAWDGGQVQACVHVCSRYDFVRGPACIRGRSGSGERKSAQCMILKLTGRKANKTLSVLSFEIIIFKKNSAFVIFQILVHIFANY